MFAGTQFRNCCCKLYEKKPNNLLWLKLLIFEFYTFYLCLDSNFMKMIGTQNYAQ